MRALKLAIISFIILFLLMTGISLFIPPHIRVSRALQINSPEQRILDVIDDPASWKYWFPGADSAMLYQENGRARGVVLNANQNRYVSLKERKSDEIIAEYKGIKQKKVLTGWTTHREESGAITVQWYMDFTLRWYPWEKFSSILFEKQYGPGLDEGLARLKRLLEEK